MLPIIVFSTLIAFLIGLPIKFYLDRTENRKRVSWPEFWISAVIIALVTVPAITYFGYNQSVKNQTTFEEYWNGWELATSINEVTCSRDGPCYWEYSCDPYQVCVTICDAEGSCHQSCHTEYHSCPYVNAEYHYVVASTLGDFRIDAFKFPENPDSHRWRSGRPVSQQVITRAGIGPSQFWLRARDRIAAGNPGPVTKREDYINYILRADRTILQEYSGDVAAFRVGNQLPQPATEIHSHYLADKVNFVGFTPTNGTMWQTALNRVNAELGRRFQGDMQLVVVQGPMNPDRYIMSLKAYWQNADSLDRGTASKNSLMVAVGTGDGQTVDWARAITGMPTGNESVTITVRNDLVGVPLTPESVIGTVEPNLVGATIRGVNVDGGLAEIVLERYPFERVEMAGFEYLKSEIRPTRGQLIGIYIFNLLITCLAWIPAVMIGDTWNRRRGRYSYSY